MSRSFRLGFTPSPGGGSLNRQSGSFDMLFREEAPRLARFFRRSGTHHDDVPDMVQESFVRLVSAAPDEPVRAPRAYLRRIARNLLFDRNKRLSARLASQHVPLDSVDGPAQPPHQAYALEAEEVLAAYRCALARLTPRTRDIFTMHREEDRSYREIADMLGITISTVEYHIARALVQLADALDQA